MAWVIAAMALVWIMIPGKSSPRMTVGYRLTELVLTGVGFFYSGLLRRKNALSMIFLSMAGVAVGSFQWFWWGYSLAFSDGANKSVRPPLHRTHMLTDPDSSVTSDTLH